MPDHSTSLAALQTRLAYTFRDPALLLRALTHASYLYDHPEALENNQRFEFLGDAVLHFILTEELFRLYPADREGVLSKRRAALAKGPSLTALAREISLDACLLLGVSERDSSLPRARALEDAFEALVGAIFLDSDLAAARRVVLALYGDLPSRLASVDETENPKGRLQELVHPRHGNDALRYEVIGTSGEEHARTYEVAVYVLDRQIGTGCGSSKKLAEEAAARVALETLRHAP